MHSQPKIARAKFGEVFARRLVRIEIVFSQVASAQAPPFPVFADDEAEREQYYRYQGLGEGCRQHVISE
jgi:hypothetical protein